MGEMDNSSSMGSRLRGNDGRLFQGHRGLMRPSGYRKWLEQMSAEPALRGETEMNREFLERFHSVRTHKRRIQAAQVVASTLLLAVCSFAFLALMDYLFELRYVTRMVGVTVVAAIVLAFGIRSLWRSMQTWNQRYTAAEIEQTFPKLGQSVRTTVQFSELKPEQIQSAGVAPTLLTALADETSTQTRPLPLETIVPSRRFRLLAIGTTVVALLVTCAAAVSWEWRTATTRAALGELTYRSLIVTPGNVRVDEGSAAEISVVLIGRTDREVVLYTRPYGQKEAEWTERTLEQESNPETSAPAEVVVSTARASILSRPRIDFRARLNRLNKPIEYRVVAGELQSDTYRIDIRSPLKLEAFSADLTPPKYTGQPIATVLDANLSALQGTLVRFQITFDKPVTSASLVFAPRRTSSEQEVSAEPEILPLIAADLDSAAASSAPADQRPGKATSAEFTVTEDRVYSIIAEAEDGTKLADNKYRIRVREDQPPQVFFESPADSVEVHTLAELPMRVRARDDYGVTKAGVVFQINNEQEIPLIAEDFELGTVAQAAEEFEKTGQVSFATQVALEKILPLEHFELTQKDSIMYFAYAEDNLPDRPQRTETDMRFIDIRPFKREYRVIDPDPMPGMGGISFKSLEELIQRQRFALNRTIQFEKRAAAGHKPDANSLDQLMKFETDLAQFVRETAQGLESRGFDDTELFYQAEAAMLQAVDSLSVGKWNNATLQMRDALKFLIEQRDRTILAILKNPDAAQLAALRSFDRQQAQKLRKPKTDKEEARELIRRLQGLANQEKEVASALTAKATPKSVQQATE